MIRFYKSLGIIIFVFAVLLVCGCSQDTNESGSLTDSSQSGVDIEQSGVNIEQSGVNVEQSGDYEVSDVLLSECVSMTTDKTAYTSKDKYIVITLVSSHKDEEIYYGDAFFIECWDGTSWKRCEKDFEWTEQELFFVNEGKYLLDLKERISVGYEKYRVVTGFDSPCSENICELAYSNEFTYIA